MVDSHAAQRSFTRRARHQKGRTSCCVQVAAARTFRVLPIVEGLYDMGNLAAVCRTSDGVRPARTSDGVRPAQLLRKIRHNR